MPRKGVAAAIEPFYNVAVNVVLHVPVLRSGHATSIANALRGAWIWITWPLPSGTRRS